MVGEYIDQFVNNSKQMSAVGIVSLIIVALMLINSIDRTLNSIWRDNSSRPMIFSFAIYWLILTLWSGDYRHGIGSVRMSLPLRTLSRQRVIAAFRRAIVKFYPVFINLVYFHCTLYGGAE